MKAMRAGDALASNVNKKPAPFSCYKAPATTLPATKLNAHDVISFRIERQRQLFAPAMVGKLAVPLKCAGYFERN